MSLHEFAIARQPRPGWHQKAAVMLRGTGASLVAMDLFACATYVTRVLARILILFAVLSIAVVTAASVAHAGRMAGMPSDHAMHLAEMTEAMPDGHAPCVGDQHCGGAHSAICDFICTGLSVVLTISGPVGADAIGPVRHDLASATCPTGRSPDLTKRPPKPRLL